MSLRKSPAIGAFPALAGLLVAMAAPVGAATPTPQPVALATYADLTDLADSAPLIARVQLRKIAQVEPQRARGLPPGTGRFYVEARTQMLYFGTSTLGESLRYLVDLPLDARGKPPKLNRKSLFIFARTVPGRPGELQLVRPDSQLLWDMASETRLTGIVAELNAPGAPGRISGVREAIHVPGTLAGQGETQVFLATPDGEPAAITVRREPGQAAIVSVSFSEVVGSDAGLPPRDSLAWYRLACFLPGSLPRGSNLSEGEAARAVAERDYRVVMDRLGPCPRTRPRALG